MISAPLSTLAHRIYRRPVCTHWLAISDGTAVRLFSDAPARALRLGALQAIEELAEGVTVWHDRVTREQIDAFDYEHLDAPVVREDAPYYPALRVATLIEMLLATRLGIEPVSHAQVLYGIRDPVFSIKTVKQAP